MRLIEKYRPKLAFGILTFFLIGIFHQPMLEGLHFLSHLDDFVKGDYSNHSIKSHSSEHQHLVINLIQEQTNSGSQDFPNSKKNTKQIDKLNHFFYSFNQNYLTKILINSLTKPLIFSPSLVFMDIPYPPPKG